jgi:hypothetical protein
MTNPFCFYSTRRGEAGFFLFFFKNKAAPENKTRVLESHTSQTISKIYHLLRLKSISEQLTKNAVKTQKKKSLFKKNQTGTSCDDTSSCQEGGKVPRERNP